MTERLKGCTVVFTHDIREDDAEVILNAIRMLKYVVRVEPILAQGNDEVIKMRLETEFAEFLYDSARRWINRNKCG